MCVHQIMLDLTTQIFLDFHAWGNSIPSCSISSSTGFPHAPLPIFIIHNSKTLQSTFYKLSHSDIKIVRRLAFSVSTTTHFLFFYTLLNIYRVNITCYYSLIILLNSLLHNHKQSPFKYIKQKIYIPLSFHDIITVLTFFLQEFKIIIDLEIYKYNTLLKLKISINFK